MAANKDIVPVENDQVFTFSGMTEKEMERRVKLFQKLAHTCFAQCVDKRYLWEELEIKEENCIARCVSKYRKATNLVGKLLGPVKPPNMGGSKL